MCVQDISNGPRCGKYFLNKKMLFDINNETERARCLLSFEMRLGRWTWVFAICGVSDFYTVGVF